MYTSDIFILKTGTYVLFIILYLIYTCILGCLFLLLYTRLINIVEFLYVCVSLSLLYDFNCDDITCTMRIVDVLENS